MRRAIVVGILLAAAVLAAACQRYGPNNPPRMRDNPELQGLRDSRRNGLPYRCASCHRQGGGAEGATRVSGG
jgi:hypothetical protein